MAFSETLRLCICPIISRYVKLPLPNARLLFKNNYAVAVIFLNTIIHRLQPHKSLFLEFFIICKFNVILVVIFSNNILVNFPQEHKFYEIEFLRDSRTPLKY
jgi:hypothetical protein